MSRHEYSPEEALTVLLSRVRGKNELLADRIAEAVDSGKDVSLREPSLDGGRKARQYRKVEPYTYEEGLQVALEALQAHLLEQPLCVNSFLENARGAAIGPPRTIFRGAGADLWNQMEPNQLRTEVGSEKAVRIEVKTETQIAREGEETVSLTPIGEDAIREQQKNFSDLRDLLTFAER